MQGALGQGWELCRPAPPDSFSHDQHPKSHGTLSPGCHLGDHAIPQMTCFLEPTARQKPFVPSLIFPVRGTVVNCFHDPLERIWVSKCFLASK